MRLGALSRAWIAALFLPLGAGAAGAQQAPDTGAAGEVIYKSCRANQQGSERECSCVAGFFAGAMKPDEFVVMSAITPFIDKSGAVADMQGALAAAQAKQRLLGMSDARFGEVMQSFAKGDELGAAADKVCVPIGKQTG